MMYPFISRKWTSNLVSVFLHFCVISSCTRVIFEPLKACRGVGLRQIFPVLSFVKAFWHAYYIIFLVDIYSCLNFVLSLHQLQTSRPPKILDIMRSAILRYFSTLFSVCPVEKLITPLFFLATTFSNCKPTLLLMVLNN